MKSVLLTLFICLVAGSSALFAQSEPPVDEDQRKESLIRAFEIYYMEVATVTDFRIESSIKNEIQMEYSEFINSLYKSIPYNQTTQGVFRQLDQYSDPYSSDTRDLLANYIEQLVFIENEAEVELSFKKIIANTINSRFNENLVSIDLPPEDYSFLFIKTDPESFAASLYLDGEFKEYVHNIKNGYMIHSKKSYRMEIREQDKSYCGEVIYLNPKERKSVNCALESE